MGREDEDRTLKLVDDLLLHVISFLPIKDALRTSVLSTRWRSLRTSFSNIDLDDSIAFSKNNPPDYPRCRTSFLHFVDRLVLGHDDSDITKFKVSCDVHVDVGRVHTWISAVIKHNVKELHLRVPLTGSCILPSCLFNSRLLTILSINVKYGILGFPALFSTSCPSLKNFNLSDITFLNDSFTIKLFSNLCSIFPKLQQLSLVYCEWININELAIISSTLVSITIEVIGGDILDCEVVVVAPQLSSFYCVTDSKISIYLYPCILVDASLESAYLADDQPVVVFQRLVKLLGGMRSSKRLSVSTETLQGSRRFFGDVPVFQKLTYLAISGFIMETTIEEILEFMQNTPNLEYLSILLDVDDCDYDEGGPVPSCPMIKLKKLKVSGLDSGKAEMDLITFFLENAPNLEEIKVCAYKWNAKQLEAVRNDLVAVPRSSKSCSFVYEILPRRIQLSEILSVCDSYVGQLWG